LEDCVSCPAIRIDRGDKIRIEIEQTKELFWLKGERITR
jgi:hypothetical protein